MRRCLSYCVCVFWGVILLFGPTISCAWAEQKSSSSPSVPSFDAQATTLSAHRAEYTLKLDSSKSQSDVVDVGGRLGYMTEDVCDGWTTTVDLVIDFTYASGDQAEIKSREVSWESKDGRRYSFSAKRSVNGVVTDDIMGKARIDEDGHVRVNFKAPKVSTRQIQRPTIFPMAHTVLILQHAARGDKIFTQHVFDGLDDVGESDVNVFIGTMQAHPEDSYLDDSVRVSSLLKRRAWPVHMAYFSDDTETGLPDYQVDGLLVDNGVMATMRMDYGDFAVKALLKNVTPLSHTGC